MNMGFDQPAERHQRMTCRPDLIGQGRDAERNTLTGKALGLAVERLVPAILLEQKHREEARSRPPARNDMERCRRLRDRLAGPAREFLPHRLDHLPLPRDHLQRLGDVLAQLRQPSAATGRAGTRRLDHHTLARQVFGKGFSGRALALETINLCRLCRGGFRGQPVFTGIGLEILELQLQLIGADGGCARRWRRIARAAVGPPPRPPCKWQPAPAPSKPEPAPSAPRRRSEG